MTQSVSIKFAPFIKNEQFLEQQEIYSQIYTIPLNSTSNQLNKLLHKFLENPKLKNKQNGDISLQIYDFYVNKHMFSNLEEILIALKIDLEKVISIEFSLRHEIGENFSRYKEDEWISYMKYIPELNEILFGDFDGNLNKIAVKTLENQENKQNLGQNNNKNDKKEFFNSNLNKILQNENIKNKSRTKFKLIELVNIDNSNDYLFQNGYLLTVKESGDINLMNISTQKTENLNKLKFDNLIDSVIFNNNFLTIALNDYTINYFAIKNLTKIDQNSQISLKNLAVINNSHKDKISGLVQPIEGVLYSSSWDCSIKFWDLSVKTQIAKWKCQNAPTSFDFSPEHNLGATSHSVGCVKTWDFRLNKKSQPATPNFSNCFNGNFWCSSIKWGPQPFSLVSGDYGGNVCVLDLRSTSKPVKSFQYGANMKENLKVFCIELWRGNGGKTCISCGGNDGINLWE